MEILKIAVLEDDPFLLEDLLYELKKFAFVNIVMYSSNPQVFIQNLVALNDINLLILDIDLGGGITGLDIANKFKMPVLFISGNTTKFNHELEDLELENNFIVDKLRKPINHEKLKIKLERLNEKLGKTGFIQPNFITIKPSGGSKQLIYAEDIKYILTSKINNRDKEVFLRNSASPIIAKEITIEELLGQLPKANFIKISPSEIINVWLVLKKIDRDTIEIEGKKLTLSDSNKTLFYTLRPELK